MIYPLIRELAEGGIPVRVTCRVLNMARQAYYRWLVGPMSESQMLQAHRANALVDEQLVRLARRQVRHLGPHREAIQQSAVHHTGARVGTMVIATPFGVGRRHDAEP